MDSWSLFIIIVPCKASPTAQEIVQLVALHWNQYFGPPRFLITDNASNLSSSKIQQFCAILNIKK
jgi:hypothetical protein